MLMTRPLHVPGTNHLLELLPPEDKTRMMSSMERVVGHQGHVLYTPNTPISHVYFPLSGIISLVTVLGDAGKRVECGTIGNEGMAGLPLLHGVAHTHLEVFFQVPGEAMRVSASAFAEEIARRGALAHVTLRYAEAFFRLVAQTAACNNIHAVEQRLSNLILMSHDRVGSDTIQLTQEFLAQMLGVRRSSVSPVASVLQRSGLIRYRRGVIVVLDRSGLEARSCECYLAVRRHFEGLLQ
jgi:CRP-like cAMP-binding protein